MSYYESRWSYRPTIQERRKHSHTHDQRHEGWPSSNRKIFVQNRSQANNHSQFVTKSMICDRKAKNPSQFFTKSLICKRKQFIRLFCPHCHTGCVSFADYRKHLHTDKHFRAMGRRIEVIQKEIENKRIEQAESQAKADRAAKRQGTLSTVQKYCAICHLKFYDEEGKHIASKLHVVLRKLLEPRCNICSYQAKDAEDYENHICSLDHLKREESWTGETKDYSTQTSKGTFKSRDSKTDEASTSSKDGTKEQSTSNEVNTELSSEDNGEYTKNANNPNGNQKDIFIKEALYCACCNLYFNCDEGQEAAKVNHCKTQQHLELWIKYVEANCKSLDGSED